MKCTRNKKLEAEAQAKSSLASPAGDGASAFRLFLYGGDKKMKKFLIALTLLALTLCSLPSAYVDAYGVRVGTSGRTFNVCYYDHNTASDIVTSEDAVFYGLYMVTDGSNDVTVEIFNGTSDAGDVIVIETVVPGAAEFFSFSQEPAIYCPDGIYIKLTTAGTVNTTVYYEK